MVRATENLGNKWFLLGRRAIRGILAVEVVRKAMFKGDPGGRPIRINLRKGPSTSVGAGVDEDEGLGRLRRPRPVHLAHILEKHDHLPTPRATIKALPTPRRPPSPLRI